MGNTSSSGASEVVAANGASGGAAVATTKQSAIGPAGGAVAGGAAAGSAAAGGAAAGGAAAGTAGGAGGAPEEEKEDEATKISKMFPMQALFYACDKGDPDLVRRAYDAGADVNTPDNGPERDPTKKDEDDELFKDAIITGDTALHKAAEKGFTEVVKLLFFLQADVEAKNRLGSTPLHRAVSTNKRDVVEFLISKGAKIEATTLAGSNTLHIASYLGHHEIAKVILDSRPDAWRLLERTNNAQMTPIDYARKKQMQQLFQTYHKPAPSEPGSMRNSARQLAGYTSQSQSKLGKNLTMPDGGGLAGGPISPANGYPSVGGLPVGSRLSVDGVSPSAAASAAAAAAAAAGAVQTIGGLTSSVEVDEKEMPQPPEQQHLLSSSSSHDVQPISNPNAEAVVEMPIEEVTHA